MDPPFGSPVPLPKAVVVGGCVVAELEVAVAAVVVVVVVVVVVGGGGGGEAVRVKFVNAWRYAGGPPVVAIGHWAWMV
jgi:hypothetical protein